MVWAWPVGRLVNVGSSQRRRISSIARVLSHHDNNLQPQKHSVVTASRAAARNRKSQREGHESILIRSNENWIDHAHAQVTPIRRLGHSGSFDL